MRPKGPDFDLYKKLIVHVTDIRNNYFSEIRILQLIKQIRRELIEIEQQIKARRTTSKLTKFV